MIPALDDLLLVPPERLVLHEAQDEKRLQVLQKRIAAEAVQRNPVVVAPFEEEFLVLDGAHRVGALKALGCRLALVQLVEPPRVAESWGHLISGADLPKLGGIEEVEEVGEEGPWLAGVEDAAGEGVFVRSREGGLAAEIRSTWALQALYPAGVVVHRVDPEASIKLATDEAAIRYRPFRPEELVELVRLGLVLPAGITRFRVPERVLGVRFPLEKLMGGDPEGRNAELRAFVKRRWDENRVRYYGEPVVLFE